MSTRCSVRSLCPTQSDICVFCRFSYGSFRLSRRQFHHRTPLYGDAHRTSTYRNRDDGATSKDGASFRIRRQLYQPRTGKEHTQSQNGSLASSGSSASSKPSHTNARPSGGLRILKTPFAGGGESPSEKQPAGVVRFTPFAQDAKPYSPSMDDAAHRNGLSGQQSGSKDPGLSWQHLRRRASPVNAGQSYTGPGSLTFGKPTSNNYNAELITREGTFTSLRPQERQTSDRPSQTQAMLDESTQYPEIVLAEGFESDLSVSEADLYAKRAEAARLANDRASRFEERKDRDKRKTRNLTYAREAITNAMEEKERAKRRREKELRRQEEASQGKGSAPKLQIPNFISAGQLAALLKQRWDRFERRLGALGYQSMQQKHVLSAENAGMIAMEYGFEPMIEERDDDLHAAPELEDVSALPSRPPVVTIMGHVDHGKTTILDYLRKSSVAASEHGGITQHIGAFSVPLKSGKAITFLDTPGHAAFLDMRQRGATVTDIVVLVVAADDSVMPQTIEAIKHAKEAKVPIIVAVNKMDKEDAQPDRVKQDLGRYGVEVEDFGGDTQAIHVSGKTGLGMDDLEEAIVTLSEIQDVRADPAANVEGWVLEGSKKKAGRSATVLVRKGTLRRGSIIVAGNTWARVRTMKNEANKVIDEVGPGMPALVEGWKDQPIAGDEVLQAPTEQKASDVVEFRKTRAEQIKLAADLDTMNQARAANEDRRKRELDAAAAEARGSVGAETQTAAADIEEEVSKGPKDVVFIIKGDVTGSVEAVLNTIMAIGNSEVRPKIIRSGVGAVSHNDIEYAAAGEGHIIAFNTSKEFGVERAAEDQGVRILEQNIIYRLEDDVKAIMSEYLPPAVKQKVTGESEIAQVFSIKLKNRTSKSIAGSRVTNGVVKLNSLARVLRGPKKLVVHSGKITSLKQVKKDVTEMVKGTECGIGVDEFEGFEVGDQIQCYDEWEEKRKL